MSTSVDLDRQLASWLTDDAGPAAPTADVVTAALALARAMPQRRGIAARLGGAEPWPRRRLAPWQRAAVVLGTLGLLAAALAGVALVGSRLVDDGPAPAVDTRFEGPFTLPAPAALAVSLGDGTILLFGGEGTAGSASNSPEAVFRLAPGSPDAAQIGTTPGTVTDAVALPDGRVLLVLPGVPARGAQSVLHLLDPATGTVTEVGETPTSHLSGEAISLGPVDSRVLLVGDAVGGSAARVFDAATGAFTEVALTSGPMRLPGAARLADGSILVVGEWNQTPERFDPATGAWTPTSPMASLREGFSVVSLADGRVLVVGGLEVQGDVSPDGLLRPTAPSTVATTAEVYDPALDRWTTVGPLVHPRWMHVAQPLPDGTVLLAGGTGSAAAGAGDGGRVDPMILEAEIFDPATGTFAPTASLAAPRLNAGAALAADGGVLVVGSVRPSAIRVDEQGATYEVYRPATGRTAPEPQPAPSDAPAPTPASDPASADAVPSALLGRWVRIADEGLSFGTGSGPAPVLALSIGQPGTTVIPSSAPIVLVPSAVGFDAATGSLGFVSQQTDGGADVAVDGKTLPFCTKGDRGDYEWSLDGDRLELRSLRADACPARAAVLPGAWRRSALGPTTGGRSVIDTLVPPVLVELPRATWMSVAELTAAADIRADDASIRIRAWEDPVAFPDGCASPEPLPQRPTTASAFLASLRATLGLEIVSEASTTIGGSVGATALVVRADGTCGAASVTAWQAGDTVGYAPAAELVAPGSTRTLVLYDTRFGDELHFHLVEVDAPDDATREAILDSMVPLPDGLMTKP